jgi:hypothetical protein
MNVFKFLCFSEYWVHIIRLHSTALTNLMELGCGCDVHVVGLPSFLSYISLFKNLKIQSRCRVRENPIMCNLRGEVRVCVCVCMCVCVSRERKKEREIGTIKMIVKCSGL